ncbi:MAG: hypothetical protein GX905_06050 [Bacteroidales bacterium]|nr:hypothetical protein [Bacteroidales bacterium]
MKRKIISLLVCLFSISFLCRIDAAEKSLEELSVAFIKHKIEKIKKENPNLTEKESKGYVDSLILNQIKVLEAKKQGIDTSFIYLNKVAEYSHILANQRLSKKRKESYMPKEDKDSIKFLQVYHLFQSIPQEVNNRTFEEKINLFDSIVFRLYQDPSQFQWYVNQYSEVKEPVWICQKQNVIEFDSQVMHLDSGEISVPFFTPAGIHLVKVIRKEFFPRKEKRNDWRSMTFDEFNSFLSVMKESNSFSYAYETPWEKNFWNPSPNQVLFRLNGKEFTKSDLDYFSKNNLTTLNKQYTGFIIKTFLDEQYVSLAREDKEYEYDLMEFKQKLLLEELTQRELEKRTSHDPLGLEFFFSLHKKNYKLELPRYQGILVLCANRKVAREVKKLLRRNAQEKWASILCERFGDTQNQFIQLQEGPFPIGSNACVDKKIFKQGSYKAPDSHPRCVMVGEVEWYPSNYLEVEERVVADYKKYLKKEWEENLLANWGKEFNEEVLKTVNKR